MEPCKRKRGADDALKNIAMRLIQTKVSCQLSKKQLDNVIEGCVGEESLLMKELVKQEIRARGLHAYRLHGCAQCDEFFWIEGENMPCPNCNNLDGRFDIDCNDYYYLFLFLLVTQHTIFLYTGMIPRRVMRCRKYFTFLYYRD